MPQGTLILRRATAADALPLLEWQRHPETRRYARNPSVPSEADHLAWFGRKIADPGCIFLLAEVAGERVGMIRLDRMSDVWELSIVVAPEQRSTGIGLAMLKTLVAPGPMIAEVLSGNERSHGLFRRAGWKPGEDGRYHWP